MQLSKLIPHSGGKLTPTNGPHCPTVAGGMWSARPSHTDGAPGQQQLEDRPAPNARWLYTQTNERTSRTVQEGARNCSILAAKAEMKWKGTVLNHFSANMGRKWRRNHDKVSFSLYKSAHH